MIDGEETTDDLRNPRLSDPNAPDQVAARVDEAQGFEIQESLPGEESEDDGYDRALAGEEEAESEEDSDRIAALDDESGLGQG